MKNRIGNEIALRAMIIVILLLSSSISTIILLGSSIPSTYAQEDSEDTFESRELEFRGESEFENIKPIDEEDLEEETMIAELLSTETPEKFIHRFEEIKDKNSFIKQKSESTFEVDLDKAKKASSGATDAQTNNQKLILEADIDKAKKASSGAMMTQGFDNDDVLHDRILFDGPTKQVCGGTAPPDPTIAVGKDHIVVMDNLCAAIYNKAGQPLRFSGQSMSGPTPLGPFFQTGNNAIFDPFVTYDQPSGRFFATIADATTGGVSLAISTPDGPLQPWLNVFIPFRLGVDPNDAFLDRPFHATSSDKFVVSGDMWDPNPPVMGMPKDDYLEVRAAVIDKACLLTENPGNCNQFVTQLGDDVKSLYPVVTSGTDEEINLVSINHTPQPSQTRLDTWTGPANNIAMSTVFAPIMLPTDPPAVAQPQPNIVIKFDGRVQRAYETPDHNFIWLTFNDACPFISPIGTVSLRACIRLIEIDKSTQSVTQDFNIADPNNGILFGALTVDSQGTLYVVFGASSNTLFPSLFAARQLPNAASDTVDEIFLIEGGTFIDDRPRDMNGNPIDPNSRYGDYFGIAPETKGKGAWIYGQYVPADPFNWGTLVGAVT